MNDIEAEERRETSPSRRARAGESASHNMCGASGCAVQMLPVARNCARRFNRLPSVEFERPRAAHCASIRRASTHEERRTMCGMSTAAAGRVEQEPEPCPSLHRIAGPPRVGKGRRLVRRAMLLRCRGATPRERRGCARLISNQHPRVHPARSNRAVCVRCLCLAVRRRLALEDKHCRSG